MDKGLFDNQQMKLDCPHCGRNLTTKYIRDLKRSPTVRCRFCSTNVKVCADPLARELRKVDKEWEKTERQFKNLNLTIKL